jgi:5-methylcytosine-specific restriction endonuclease McrA
VPKYRMTPAGLRPHGEPRHRRPHQRFRHTAAWQRLRARVLEEEASCRECGSVERPQVDHIHSIIDRPDLIFARHNLRRLCARCNREKG